MATQTHGRTPSLGGTSGNSPSIPTRVRTPIFPFLTLGLIVIASAAQTEVAHTLTSKINYNQPYFTFFLTHITFSFIFPLHLIFLRLTTPSISISTYLDSIRTVIAIQLKYHPSTKWKRILKGWSMKIIWLTLLISIPALSWFIAMLYSPAIDITAIYATSAFWAYFFSMILLSQPLSKVTVGSIGLAFAGVVVLSLDGMGEGETKSLQEEEEGGMLKGRAFGDMIMMFGAVLLGLYEVVYKMILPEGQGGTDQNHTHAPSTSSYTALPQTTDDIEYPYDPTPPISGSTTPQIIHPQPETIYPTPRHPSHRDIIPLSASQSPTIKTKPSPLDRMVSRTPLLVDSRPPSPSLLPQSHTGSVQLPPALHANFLTSCIGFATLLLLWPPLFILHWTEWEVFRWPAGDGVSSSTVWAGLAVVAWAGAFYNAGLMILIGIWGPTTSSVANLLTIGLVAVIDAVLMGLLPSIQTLVGVGMICIGFGILLWEGE